MILTGDEGSTWRKICPSPALFTRNSTWRESPGLRLDRTATNHL